MIEELQEISTEHFGRQIILEVRENDRPLSIQIALEDVLRLCHLLHTHESFYFDMLSCITGIDHGPEDGTMEVVYNIYSIPYERSLMIRTVIPRTSPVIESVSGIWRTGDWLERETFDFFGIEFTGHPDLRRILLPGDWEGYPLRKDYIHQEYYHGIQVKY